MIPESTIQLLVSLSILGLVAGSVFSWLGKRRAIELLSQSVVLVSLAFGAFGVGAYIISGAAEPLAIFPSLHWLSGAFALTPLSAIFALLILLVSIPAIIFGYRYLSDDRAHYAVRYVQSITASFILGLLLVTLSRTPLAFFFSWEVMSFTSFLLVFAGFRKESLHAALFYFIMTHLGAGAILLGFLILTGGSLTMGFTSIPEHAASVPAPYAIAALMLFFFGFGSKAGLFPFHGWLPEAHPEAPSHISALLSGVMLAVAVYGMINILPLFPVFPLWFSTLVLALGLLSALFGAFYSIIDIDIKRILAWSSIENMGLIFALIGISLFAANEGMSVLSDAMLALSVFLALAHAFFKSGLFLASGVLSLIFHTRSIERMGGVAKGMKVFSALVLALALAAAALPPFGPFTGEITAIQSMLAGSLSASLPLKIAILATIGTFGIVAGAVAFAMVKFFGIAFLAQPRSTLADVSREPHGEYLFSIAFLTAGVALLGIFAQRVFDAIARAFGEMPVNGAVVPVDMLSLALLLVFVLSIAGIIGMLASGKRRERSYPTWDCGQPIDATMEYTGTAFSAPVRFLFKPLLKASRNLSVRPISNENRWIVEKRVHIDVEPLSDVYFYLPLSRVMSFASTLVRKIQSGNIHFYIMLILLTLIVCAIIAL